MQRVQVVAVAHEQHRRVADLDRARLAVVERVGAERVGPVAEPTVEDRLIDALAEAQGEVAAEVAGGAHPARAGEREQHPARGLPWRRLRSEHA